VEAEAFERAQIELCQELCRRDVEGAADSEYYEESWLLVSLLESTDVVLVQICCFRELFLGEPALLAQLPHTPAELL
jgi:hypothetical protein